MFKREYDFPQIENKPNKQGMRQQESSIFKGEHRFQDQT